MRPLTRAAVLLAKGVHQTPLGTREFVIHDDQGHPLNFGELQASAPGET
jgi:hypothetical protein